MKLSLLVAEGVHAGKEVPVGKFPFTVGRSSSCNLRPTSEKVSKQHCCLLLRAGKLFVHDFNSRNGTFVNGEKVVQPTELHDGDALKIGPLGFTVRLSVPVDQATPLPFHADESTPNDDEIADLLLEMDANEAEAENAAHSTTVEIPRPVLPVTPPAPVAAAPSRPTAPPKPAASTADAAHKLLAAMARRDRK